MNPEKFEIVDYIIDEDEYMRERRESLEETHRDVKKLNEELGLDLPELCDTSELDREHLEALRDLKPYRPKREHVKGDIIYFKDCMKKAGIEILASFSHYGLSFILTREEKLKLYLIHSDSTWYMLEAGDGAFWVAVKPMYKRSAFEILKEVFNTILNKSQASAVFLQGRHAQMSFILSSTNAMDKDSLSFRYMGQGFDDSLDLKNIESPKSLSEVDVSDILKNIKKTYRAINLDKYYFSLMHFEYPKLRVQKDSQKVYLSLTPNKVNDGLSWTTAFNDVQAAIDACSKIGGELRVEVGVYELDYTLELKNNVHIVGGFGGTEKHPFSEEYPHKTVFSGGGKIRVIDAYSVNNTCLLESLTIADGFGEYISALNVEDASPIFHNCTFENNVSSKDGCVLRLLKSASSFNQCIFRNNIAKENATIVSILDSLVEIKNSIMDFNEIEDTSLIFVNNSVCVLKNSILSDNEVSSDYALMNSVYSNFISLNNNIIRNKVAITLASVYSNTIVKNSILCLNEKYKGEDLNIKVFGKDIVRVENTILKKESIDNSAQDDDSNLDLHGLIEDIGRFENLYLYTDAGEKRIINTVSLSPCDILTKFAYLKGVGIDELGAHDRRAFSFNREKKIQETKFVTFNFRRFIESMWRINKLKTMHFCTATLKKKRK